MFCYLNPQSKDSYVSYQLNFQGNLSTENPHNSIIFRNSAREEIEQSKMDIIIVADDWSCLSASMFFCKIFTFGFILILPRKCETQN